MTDLFEKLNDSKKKQTETEQEFLPLDFFEGASRKAGRNTKKIKDEKIGELVEPASETEVLPEKNTVNTEKEKPFENAIKGEVRDIEPEIQEQLKNNIEPVGNTEIKAEEEKKKTHDLENEADKKAESIRKENEIKVSPFSENDDKEKNKNGVSAIHHISKKTVNEAGKSNMSHIKPVRSIGSLTGKDTSVGQTLHEAREAKGLSHIEVEQKTKIKAEFIRLLENDDYSRLPPMVYIIAYIKTLSALYGIPQEDAMLLVSSLKKGKETPSVAEDAINNAEPEKYVNPEIKAKNKKILLISIAIGIFALIWIVGIVFLISHKGKKTTPAKTTEVKTTVPGTPLKDSKVKTATPVPVSTPAPVQPVKPVTPPPATSKPAEKKPVKTPEPPKDSPKDPKKKTTANDQKPAETKPAFKFSSTELEKFIPPQTMAVSELPLDGKLAKK